MDEAKPTRPIVRRRGRGPARPHRVNLALSDEEFAAIISAAATRQMTPGAWASEAAVAVAREEIAPIPTDEASRLRELVQATVQVQRIGTNLNQIARKINMDIEAPELSTVLRLVERAMADLDAAAVSIIGGRRGK